jgi:Ca2+-binding EF-hand superfamily protein
MFKNILSKAKKKPINKNFILIMSDITKNSYYIDLENEIKKKSLEYFKIIDRDNNNFIDLKEWVDIEEIISSFLREKFNLEKVKTEFNSFDKNKDGLISEDEFIKGNLLTLSECAKEIDNLDFDGYKELKNNLVEKFDVVIYTKSIRNKMVLN